jgi:uncharacterized protein (DUF3084 family)
MIIPPVSSINSIPSSAPPENQIKQIEGQITKLRSQIAKLSQKNSDANEEYKSILQNQVSQLRMIIEQIKLDGAKRNKEEQNPVSAVDVKV